MERIPESKKTLPGQLPIVGLVAKQHMALLRQEVGRPDARDSQDSDSSPAPIRTWKGKDSLLEQEESMPDVVKGSSDSFEEGGPSSFSGASHPQNP
ncbi:hypothetical protein CK203_078921 [Vitis vinifera]|uniref:Uncharacterized protein n=1 Tax=Vitis vinifera TaxID=29760 RepID=A0A438DA58_VITVI|nr:hypothetical protein CK203_078921 [Vitis vinifera]